MGGVNLSLLGKSLPDEWVRRYPRGVYSVMLCSSCGEDYVHILEKVDQIGVTREEILGANFGEVIDGSLEEKLAFLRQGVQMESSRFKNYRDAVSSGVQDLSDPLSSLQKGLVFRCQERILAPFAVAQLLGIKYYEQNISKFLANMDAALTNIYTISFSRRFVSGKVPASNPLPQIENFVNGNYREGNIPFLEEEYESLSNAAEIAFEKAEGKGIVKVNGLEVGAIVKGDVKIYAPLIRVFPFDWKGHCSKTEFLVR